MATTLKAAVESYLGAKTVARGTRNEYLSTLRKWEQWGGGPPIEALQHKEIREFLAWVHERALAEDGTNPGRTANKAREHLRAAESGRPAADAFVRAQRRVSWNTKPPATFRP